MPKVEEAEPSGPDSIPIPRARYGGPFVPPVSSVIVKDTSRRSQSPDRGGRLGPEQPGPLGPVQPNTPLADAQLEELSVEYLSSSSNFWSADARNMPASTSDSSAVVEETLERIRGKGAHTVMAALDGLTKRGELDAVPKVLSECSKSMIETVAKRWRYEKFLEAVALPGKARPALQFCKLTLPHVQRPAKLTMAVLQACARCRDLEGGAAVVEAARKAGIKVDAEMMTTLIKVAKSVGSVDRAYRLYLDMRGAGMRIDGHVYGCLIAACAEAMKRDLQVVHERKDQFVLLERAHQIVADAEAAGVALQAPVWNALMVCAGRSGELNRAFEVLTAMQSRSVAASAPTYGALIEACVNAGQPDKALRVFEVAMQKGFSGEVRLYTQALSACMLPHPGAWARAESLYMALQRAGVRADKKFFACLIAVAGRCGRLETAFEVLSDMAAEGLRPSGTTVSALIHACLGAGNLSLARRVYGLCGRQGVYPVPSQVNRMMDMYAVEGRFGEVVSLLCDMVAAGRQPNLNTYRVLINACEFTDQAGLAFQIFALMHANKVPILQAKFAETIYYMLIKACFNQTRFLWAPPNGYPPEGPQSRPSPSSASSSPSIPSSSPQGQPQQQVRTPQPERRAEAEALLAALGASKLRGAHRSNPFDGPPDTIDWASHALSAFHHMLGRGFRPTLELLDLLLNCMRLRMEPEEGEDGDAGPSYLAPPFVHMRPRNQVFEAAFEARAFGVLEEAISRGLLPRFDPEAPLVMDMRGLPPAVAEVYCLHILAVLERRQRKAEAAGAADRALALGERAGLAGGAGGGGGGGAAGGSGGAYNHSITLLTPPFDPDLIKWPSYVERLVNRYTAMMDPEEVAKLRHRSATRRTRTGRRRAPLAAAAARAAAAANPALSSSIHAAHEPGAPMSSYDELEAAISDEDSDQDPWSEEDEEAAAGGGPGGGPMGRGYAADSTTGLAVSATLMRMKVWMDMDHVNGVVTVFAVEVGRWLKRRRQAAEAAAARRALAASAEPAGAGGVAGGMVAAAGMAAGARLMGRGGPMGRGPLGMPGASLEQQQRNIRMGMMGPGAGPGMGPGMGSGSALGPGAGAGLSGGFGPPGPAPHMQAQQQPGQYHSPAGSGSGSHAAEAAGSGPGSSGGGGGSGAVSGVVRSRQAVVRAALRGPVRPASAPVGGSAGTAPHGEASAGGDSPTSSMDGAAGVNGYGEARQRPRSRTRGSSLFGGGGSSSGNGAEAAGAPHGNGQGRPGGENGDGDVAAAAPNGAGRQAPAAAAVPHPNGAAQGPGIRLHPRPQLQAAAEAQGAGGGLQVTVEPGMRVVVGGGAGPVAEATGAVAASP